MSEEIKVGEYVRTKKGQIDRLHCEINKDSWRSKDNYGNIIARCEKNKYWLEDIVKHSKNLIDLIEVGDHVNGRLVLQVDYKSKNICLLIPITDTKANTNIMWYGYEDIKSILTKGQMKSVEYEVK